MGGWEEECSDESLGEDGGDSIREKRIKVATSGSLEQARALCDVLDRLLDLCGADLREAQLSGTRLDKTKREQTKRGQTDLSSAEYDDQTKCPKGFDKSRPR